MICVRCDVYKCVVDVFVRVLAIFVVVVVVECCCILIKIIVVVR